MSRISTVLAVALAAAAGTALVATAACSVGRAGSAPSLPAKDGSDEASDAGETETVVPDTGSIAPVPDASLRADADADAGDSGAACSGLICNGQCVATDDCTACTGAPLLCAANHACVSACSGCDGQPTECFSCDAQHANPIGTCGPASASAYCLDGNYFGSYRGGAGYHCGCSDGGSGSCPGNSQTCVTIGSAPVCVTCGEPVPSGFIAGACKRGGTCSANALTCQ